MRGCNGRNTIALDCHDDEGREIKGQRSSQPCWGRRAIDKRNKDTPLPFRASVSRISKATSSVFLHDTITRED